MKEKEEFFTDEERKKPYWYSGDKFQIYTSHDPNVLGLHIAPWGSNVAYQNMNDICVFNIDWTRQYLHRMNGFMAGNYKIVLHDHCWEPKDGYEENIYVPEVGNGLGFT